MSGRARPRSPARRKPLVPPEPEPRAPADDHSDRSLVGAFQAGRQSAFEQIFRRHHPWVLRLCRRYLNSPQEAEEAAQETMLRVFCGLVRFDRTYPLEPWIRRIATNLCFDLLRARARLHGGPLPAGALEGDDRDPHGLLRAANGAFADPSAAADALERGEEVRQTLARLPQAHRRALELRDLEGRSHEEIGRVLGLSRTQAKALIHRARLAFRRAWAEGSSGPARGLLLPLPLWRSRGVLRRLALQPRTPAIGRSVLTAGEITQRLAGGLVATVLAGGIGGSITWESRHRANEGVRALPWVALPSPRPSGEVPIDGGPADTGPHVVSPAPGGAGGERPSPGGPPGPWGAPPGLAGAGSLEVVGGAPGVAAPAVSGAPALSVETPGDAKPVADALAGVDAGRPTEAGSPADEGDASLSGAPPPAVDLPPSEAPALPAWPELSAVAPLATAPFGRLGASDPAPLTSPSSPWS